MGLRAGSRGAILPCSGPLRRFAACGNARPLRFAMLPRARASPDGACAHPAGLTPHRRLRDPHKRAKSWDVAPRLAPPPREGAPAAMERMVFQAFVAGGARLVLLGFGLAAEPFAPFIFIVRDRFARARA